DTHQDVPNFGCRSENWELCRRKPPNAYITNTLDKTIGSSGDEQIMSTRFEDNPFVTDEAQITVYLFGQLLTSTGTRAPIVVLYTDLLITDSQYILYLDTFNPLTNNTGSASQLITFSPPPTVESCRVSPLPGRNGSWFSGTCDEVKGHYYPVLLEWSYHFLWRDVKTVFYYGARTSFDFTLPSGLESNDYKVYVSVKAIDGKGVSNKYPDVIELVVYPISRTGDGILSIFQEISTLENESPSLLLQQVRSLAWELNLIVTTEVTETIIDNILAIIFYASCQESLETVTDPTYKLGLQYLKTSQNDRRDIFVEVNLLKSCARDHLAEIIGELPIRDEMEVLQVLTALQIIVDAQEYISSHTYIRVFENMHMAAKRIWFSSSPELKDEVVQEFFILSSAMLDKQREIYDWNSTSVHLINSLINLLQEVMEADTRTRFLEEEPLVMSTDYLKFHGFLSDAENINRWNRSLPFLFEPDSIPSGVHLVQSLIHLQTPYNVTQDPITSEVINVCLQLSSDFVRRVKVKIKRSQLLMAAGYDFRRPGVLTPASLSVYEFEVTAQYDSMAFHILLQFTKILNSDYPVAAELIATSEPSRVTLFIPPDTLAHGKKLLIIMDKNSYENNWARFNSSKISGADFLVSGWWSQCLVWGDNQWHAQNCTVIAEESSWDYTTCSCSSIYSVYGAQSITILDEESKMDVNELMLHETYLALYFMVFLLVVYFVFALALQTSDRHRLRRRNIWLRDNKPQHEWAYLLTIKTGTQWNAGTTAKVYAILHGTHGMSETRELQSKQTGQLFTRGALCTFILTTPEPLGDILKVQVWHDNSGGSESGWYVCETSVADLVLGARYAYPCYRWLSVQADDAKVEREITLESPTTFIQDFEHFLPQYASEHMLWTSLLTTSNTSKLYRLQRLTICLIVCLCMGTVSLSFVQEEKEYNSKSVLDTLRATREIITFPQTMSDQEDSFEEEVYNPQSQVWRNLASWAQSVEITNTDAIHPVLLQNQEGMQVTQRSRSNADNDPRAPPVESEFRRNSVDPLATTAQLTTVPNIMNDNREAASTKKCSLTIFHFLSELPMCCMTLFVQGSGMSVDYGSLWAHIIYITLCCSMFVMQPLVIVIYTLYKVCMYRWFGSRGCISSCVTVPLDQVVAIWNRYQTVLLRQNYSGKNTNMLEERQRTRDLRFAHPPSEQYLLKCREKELRREHVSSLLCSTVGHLLFLALLIIIASNSNIEESYKLNRAVYSALENGTCLDSARYEDACTSIGSNGDSCNTVENKNYMKFKHIHTKEDWWKWAYTELLALTYNTDKTYSTDCIFCDTNSIVIGMPRIRKYDIYSQECEASKVKIGNMSFADLLKVKTCFPDYIDEVPHLFSFRLDMDKEYEWDAHFLAVTYGLFGQYSYTPHKQSLSGSRFITILWLMILQGSDWLNENMTRAVVTDFTLYHPQTKLYTTVMLLAEFPSLSGAKTKTSAWSSHIERYSSDWSIVCMVAEIVLLAIAMYYLYHTTIYVYTCRFKIWKCFWGLLDVLMTVLSWSYMVCLMLRVQIAEDAMWQLRVAYFKKFVNLTGLATWDNILEALIGGMLTVHLLRCLCLMRYLPRLRRLGLILASAAKDVLCIRITWAHLPFLTKVERESSGCVSFLGYLYYLVAYVLLYQVARALYIAAFLYARKKYVDKPGLEVKWKDITSYIRGRCRSLVHKVRRKKEEMDFYMTELDLQITQVMTRLDTMAETLGLVIDRVDDLIEEDQLAVLRTCDGVEVLKMTKDSSDNEAWQLEDEVTNSTFKMELEAMLKPLQSCGQDPMKEAGSKTLISSQVTSLEARNDSHKHQYETIFDTPMETSFNLDAFTDIASCQTEIEAFTRNWNLNSACYGQLKFGTKDDGGTMAKFLKDVSAASDESVTSYGKYGKTVSKLKVSPKLHPSHESLATNQYLYNNNSSTSETAGLCPAQSRVTTRQCTLGLQSAAQGTQLVQHETPMQSPLGISSRLCRTQTQGRGKGHVDVLDIVSLESDSEDESGC
ncbi:Polycystic kidney disease 1 like 1-like, partial [Homarus americanus]